MPCASRHALVTVCDHLRSLCHLPCHGARQPHQVRGLTRLTIEAVSGAGRDRVLAQRGPALAFLCTLLGRHPTTTESSLPPTSHYATDSASRGHRPFAHNAPDGAHGDSTPTSLGGRRSRLLTARALCPCFRPRVHLTPPERRGIRRKAHNRGARHTRPLFVKERRGAIGAPPPTDSRSPPASYASLGCVLRNPTPGPAPAKVREDEYLWNVLRHGSILPR